MQTIINFCNEIWTIFISSQSLLNELQSLVGVSNLFSRRMAALAVSANTPFPKKEENLLPLSIECSLLIRIANFVSTLSFYCGMLGMLGMVYLN